MISLLKQINNTYDVTLLLLNKYGPLLEEIPDNVRILQTKSDFRYMGMAQVVEKNGIGVLIDYSKEGFSEGVEKLISCKDEWDQIEKRMRELYIKSYSWNEMEQRLLKLYSMVLCDLK